MTKFVTVLAEQPDYPRAMSDLSPVEATMALLVPPEARGRLLDPTGPLSGQGIRERFAAFYFAMGFVCLVAMAKSEAELARDLRAPET